MEIFHNRDRPNYEEVVSYGPKWWIEYREMDANYHFAGWTLDLMAYFLEQTVKNQFPLQADERTIAMFERMLRIEYDAEMTLEERRRAVAAFYSGTGHLSRSVILQLIKAYTGHDGDVYWDGDILCIVLDDNNNCLSSIEPLQKILSRRMPAHIAYSLILKEEYHHNVYASVAHMFTPHLVIQCEKLNYYHLRNRVGIKHVMNKKIIIQ